jgi:hypothetical protein
MHENGITYTEIASYYGICPQRANAIVKTARREQELSKQWPFWALLSNRARNIITKEYGEKAFSNPKLIIRRGRRHFPRLRNVGKYTLRELETALVQIGIIEEGQEW